MPEGHRSTTDATVVDAVERIVVTLQVGGDRMGGTADPVFLQLLGPSGREFRLELRKGRSFRRKERNVFVLAAAEADEINVSEPALNDPTRPVIDSRGISGVVIRKGLNPIPNVRGLAEMDDRLLIDSVEVEVHSDRAAEPERWHREGPIWLGLVCGLRVELERA